MTPQEFMDNFSTMAEAPGGVGSLRKLVLGLALHGKLSTRSDADESAQTLLKRLVRSIQVAGDEIRVDEVEVALPPSWAWVAVADVADCVLGKMLDRSKHTKGTARPYMRNINVRWGRFDLSDLLTMYFEDDELDRFGVRVGDVLICEGGEPGRAAVWTDATLTMLIQKAIHRVRSKGAFIPDWLVMNLRYDTWVGRLDRYFTGATIKHFTGQSLARYTIRLPPLPEQHRIVAKVDQLMALLDELEAKQGKRHNTVVRATGACLDALTTADGPEEVAEAWKRVAGDWRVLFDRSEAVGELRGVVRQLAIMGRLVEQDSNDVPAVQLLASVNSRPEVSGKPPILDVDSPFDPPPGWEWAPASAITAESTVITYGILKPSWVRDGVPTVRVKDIKDGAIDLRDIAQCSEERAAKFRKTTLAAGDLLVAKDGATLGKSAFVPACLEGGNVTQHVLRFSISGAMCREYVRLVVDSPHGQRWMKGETKGVALPGVNVEDFRRMPMPIPPLSEQRRIVAKVDLLMALCDDLEAKLKQRDNRAGKLVESVVQEIVSAEREVEAVTATVPTEVSVAPATAAKKPKGTGREGKRAQA